MNLGHRLVAAAIRRHCLPILCPSLLLLPHSIPLHVGSMCWTSRLHTARYCICSRHMPFSFMSSLMLSIHCCFGLSIFLVPCTSKAIVLFFHIFYMTNPPQALPAALSLMFLPLSSSLRFFHYLSYPALELHGTHPPQHYDFHHTQRLLMHFLHRQTCQVYRSTR